MAKINIKYENSTPIEGIFHVEVAFCYQNDIKIVFTLFNTGKASICVIFLVTLQPCNVLIANIIKTNDQQNILQIHLASRHVAEQ